MRDTFLKLKHDDVAFLPDAFGSSWYASNKEEIENFLLIHSGNRPLVYTREFILTAVLTELLARKYMLDTLYDTMNFDYNPIWNVDGTETIEYTKDNTGTVRNIESINESIQRAIDVEDTHTGTDANAHTGTTTTADTGTETNVMDYDDSVTHGGTVTTNHTGTDANAHTGTVTNAEDVTDTATTSKTAYNDATFVNAEKVTDVVDKDTTTNYNDTTTETRNLSDAEIINTNDLTAKDVTETKTLNTSATTTHADTITETRNLTDVRDEDSTETRTGSNSDLRTDALTEDYTETRTRGGNIGVTSTQSLIGQEREVAKFSFIEVVCKVITDAVCLGVWEDD